MGLFILLLVLAALSFLFAASETSVIGLSKIRLRHMLAQGVKRARHVHNLATKLDKFIAAILIGNNIVNITISAIVTGIFVEAYGYKYGVIFATFVTTFFVLVFCEITPKILATKHTEKVALFTAPLMEFMIKALHPAIAFFIGISEIILKAFGIRHPKRSPLITEEELRLMIEVGKEEGVLSDEERKMFHRIFEFGETRVKDVMVPRDKMVAVSTKTSDEELMNIFVEEGHARLPVYQDTPENIVGVIYARDLLYVLREKSLFLLDDLIHGVFYAPAAMRVNELLMKFQSDKIQIAIVVDEHKKALGLVTLEDLIEEIIGEVEEKNTDIFTNKN